MLQNLVLFYKGEKLVEICSKNLKTGLRGKHDDDVKKLAVVRLRHSPEAYHELRNEVKMILNESGY